MTIDDFWLQTDPGDLRMVYFWAGSITSIFIGTTQLLTIVNPLDATGFRIDVQRLSAIDRTKGGGGYFSYTKYVEVKAIY